MDINTKETEVVRSDDSEEIQSFYTDKNILKVIDGERTLDIIIVEMERFVLNKI